MSSIPVSRLRLLIYFVCASVVRAPLSVINGALPYRPPVVSKLLRSFDLLRVPQPLGQGTVLGLTIRFSRCCARFREVSLSLASSTIIPLPSPFVKLFFDFILFPLFVRFFFAAIGFFRLSGLFRHQFRPQYFLYFVGYSRF